MYLPSTCSSNTPSITVRLLYRSLSSVTVVLLYASSSRTSFFAVCPRSLYRYSAGAMLPCDCSSCAIPLMWSYSLNLAVAVPRGFSSNRASAVAVPPCASSSRVSAFACHCRLSSRTAPSQCLPGQYRGVKQ